jgi:hypothetical protein
MFAYSKFRVHLQKEINQKNRNYDNQENNSQTAISNELLEDCKQY